MKLYFMSSEHTVFKFGKQNSIYVVFEFIELYFSVWKDYFHVKSLRKLKGREGTQTTK